MRWVKRAAVALVVSAVAWYYGFELVYWTLYAVGCLRSGCARC